MKIKSLFKPATKEELLKNIEKKAEKDKERIIDALIELEDHYEIPSLRELSKQSLHELTQLHQAYIRALKEDVGE